MGLAEDINQTKPFVNHKQKVLVNILYTSSWLNSSIKEALAPYQITIQQYNVLRILRGAKEPISTSTIRERMIDKMSDTSRIVHRLTSKDLVNCVPCSYDKRKVDITLSKKGVNLLNILDEEQDILFDLVFRLSEDEAKQLSDLLDKLRG